MNLTPKHVLAVVLVVGISTAAGAGSYAYLTDSGTSEISLMTGSLDVQANPGVLDFGDINESTVSAEVSLTNEGTLPARQLHWTDLGLSGAEDQTVAAALVLEKVEYRGTDVTDNVTARVDGHGNGNGIYDLQDVSSFLAAENLDLEALAGDGDGLDPKGQETAELAVTVSVDYSQNITQDNMAMTATVDVTGHQNANATVG